MKLRNEFLVARSLNENYTHSTIASFQFHIIDRGVQHDLWFLTDNKRKHIL